ncbi:MAG: F0F1 ATP synthase subunit A [Gammaproteobacteria bacterium]|jgi:F-type H+-transporting ATPase subunit a|nr:F0F1 ATP synthase subunit A [Gammaproteobacteria bacterium]MBP6052438.1 F0F1 ATP synthase subunit A [Pseudomonadales bacterium]MBK6583179.1 F0F1 ATP synthase subunit A [Gammaproteobacteria bacterium]MBK7170642.1 F0F1 ATP synthase subunit A [Gammaproteobacteria bacterium]MBK7519313.1 F0F1 ATP synthase subunit A [Gammaproteobacteria bacterium]
MNSDLLHRGGIDLGLFTLSETVLDTWGLMLLLTGVSWLVTRRLQFNPGRWQTVLEGVVSVACNAIEGMQPGHIRELMPLITTLWIFLVFANLMGLVPGLHSPTEDLSLTAALAIIVFVSVHWYGIRISGFRAYMRHYLSPTPLMLPFHVLSEITRTLALAVRLFGNMMSLSMAALLVLMVAGFLAPVPILMLHIVEALVQAYIFGILALIYIASGLQSQQSRLEQPEGETHE